MPTRHKNVSALLRSGQEASGLFLYLHEICVGLGSAIVLVGSVSGASLRIKEAEEKGRGLLQLHATAARTPTHIQVPASGSWTTKSLSSSGCFSRVQAASS